MNCAMASGVRGVMTRTAVAVALMGMAATGATVPANATPGFASVPGTPVLLDDPNPPPPPTPTGPSDPPMRHHAY
jgi:hypothetical protein